MIEKSTSNASENGAAQEAIRRLLRMVLSASSIVAAGCAPAMARQSTPTTNVAEAAEYLNRDLVSRAASVCGYRSIEFSGDDPEVFPAGGIMASDIIAQYLVFWCRAYGMHGDRTQRLTVSIQSAGSFIDSVVLAPEGKSPIKVTYADVSREFSYGDRAPMALRYLGVVARRAVEVSSGSHRLDPRVLFDRACALAWRRSGPRVADIAESSPGPVVELTSLDQLPYGGSAVPRFGRLKPVKIEPDVARTMVGVMGEWRSPGPGRIQFYPTTVVRSLVSSRRCISTTSMVLPPKSPFDLQTTRKVAELMTSLPLRVQGMRDLQEIVAPLQACDTVTVGGPIGEYVKTGMASLDSHPGGLRVNVSAFFVLLPDGRSAWDATVGLWRGDGRAEPFCESNIFN